MIRIADGIHAYGYPGICPVCGAQTRPVQLYSAHTTTSRGPTVIDTTYYTTRYEHIAPTTVGFCDRCAQNELEAKGNAKPKAGGWLKGFIITLAAIGGFAAAVKLELQEPTSTVVMGIAFFVLIYGLYWFVTDFRAYRKQRRVYMSYKRGTNAPYEPWSAETLASALTRALDGYAYLTPERALQMLGGKKNQA